MRTGSPEHVEWEAQINRDYSRQDWPLIVYKPAENKADPPVSKRVFSADELKLAKKEGWEPAKDPGQPAPVSKPSAGELKAAKEAKEAEKAEKAEKANKPQSTPKETK